MKLLEQRRNKLTTIVNWETVTATPPRKKFFQSTTPVDERIRWNQELENNVDRELQKILEAHGLIGEKEVTLLALAEGLNIDAKRERTRLEALSGLITYEKMIEEVNAWAGGILRFRWQHGETSFISEIPLTKLQIEAMNAEAHPSEAMNSRMSFSFNRPSLVKASGLWSAEVANYNHPNMYIQGSNLVTARLTLPTKLPNLETPNQELYLLG